jgi:hypothetical protein
MANAESTTDWQFNPEYVANYDVDMSKWPSILDKTNLKAIPISGLGIGGLALSGRDDRSARWLARANASADEYLSLFSEDGGYFEGISYADYSLRYLTAYFEASMRNARGIDWKERVDFRGTTQFLLACQMGVRPDGVRRDIVNFSDSNFSFHASPLLWIAKRGGDRLAQYAARRFSERSRFTDWLWHDPELDATPPPTSLLNARFDLDWIICRTGWDDEANILAFRSGMPANHEHADRNSFILKAYGERLLTDHYGASYDWRQKGWLLRLTEAHNSVLIDGKGHQYHDGSEGTNASQAEARVTRFVNEGEVVWWSSDASQAYGLVHDGLESVIRSVLFVKPDLVILVDRVESDREVEVSCRFHPDNTDGSAAIEVESNGVRIVRPRASLSCRFASERSLRVDKGRLDVPVDDLAHLGDGEVESRPVPVYSFAEVRAERGRVTEIVSVLTVSKGSDVRAAEVEQTDSGWAVSAPGLLVEVGRDDGGTTFDVVRS